MYYSPGQLLTPSFDHFYVPPQMHCIHEQGSGAVNEDVLLYEGNVFGVFDGATSLGETRSGITGGLMAARIAADTFSVDARDLAEVAAEANRRIARAQGIEGVSDRTGLWSASMAVVRLEGDMLDYCRLGDASILLILEDGGYRLLTPDLDIDRETLSLWKKLGGSGGSIYELLAGQIRRVRNTMNVEYGVLNGEPAAMNFLQYGRVDLEGVSDILLFTDGLSIPKEDPEKEHDWQTFVELYRQGGLDTVQEHVRTLQAHDPQCTLYPRFKIHDDIAALAISL